MQDKESKLNKVMPEKYTSDLEMRWWSVGAEYVVIALLN